MTPSVGPYLQFKKKMCNESKTTILYESILGEKIKMDDKIYE